MAWCAGFVDSACFRRLYGTYTSHVTGNTASLARSAAAAQWHDAARFAIAIASFLTGLMVSAALQHVERRKGIRSAFAAVLALEILLLGLFIPLSAAYAPIPLLIFLPAAAMGLQTVTVTRVARLRVFTTYLTGNLSQFAEAAAACFFADTDHAESRRRAVVTGSLWLAFLAGALAGIAAERAWGAIALLCPMVVLAGAIPVDLRRPRALGDTAPEQSVTVV